MYEEMRRRLRQVALTGVLTPGLMLGVVGTLGTAHAAAQSNSTTDACTAFGSPSGGANQLSVADLAAQVDPAVVTIVNLQQMSTGGMSGIPGISGFPDSPMMPGIDSIPGIDTPSNGQGINQNEQQAEGDDSDTGSQHDESLPEGVDDVDPGQSSETLPEGADDAAQQAIGTASDTAVPVGTGSGFIVDEAGHVVTNAHVVAGAQDLTVTLADGTDVPATVVGKDDVLDVALLSLDLPAGTKVPGIVAFGDSSTLRAGDQVVAIGNALGEFPNTVSEGTVNGMHRSFPGVYGLSAMIQHDAEIWHGNSGGPLLNLQGEVVGINTAGIGSGMMGTDTGAASMGFAIESNVVCNAAADLLNDGQNVWPYLGIQAEATLDGQGVVEVVADGPSAKAGLQPGDLITGLDGQQVDALHTLLDLLYGHKPGDVVDLAVDRNGATSVMPVTLGERPEITQ